MVIDEAVNIVIEGYTDTFRLYLDIKINYTINQAADTTKLKM